MHHPSSITVSPSAQLSSELDADESPQSILHKELQRWCPESSFDLVRIWIGSWNMGAKEYSEKTIAFDLKNILALSSSSPSPLDQVHYDLIVWGLQEAIEVTEKDKIEPQNSAPNIALFIELTRQLAPFGYAWIPLSTRVSGRGDGSFVRAKHTAIGVWVSSKVMPFVRILNESSSSSGMTEGSKGGASVALKIYTQTVVFISVHLSSRKKKDRRQAYSRLIEKVGNNCGDEYMQLLEQFHHVFLFGDLNYRLEKDLENTATNSGMLRNAEDVLNLIEKQDLASLVQHDELRLEMEQGLAFCNFREAPISFWPTYKKFEDRPLPVDYFSCGKKSKSNWVRDHYRVLYKEPWYKGVHKGIRSFFSTPSNGSAHAGPADGMVERIPAYCDRIVYHSLPSFAHDIRSELCVLPLLEMPNSPRSPSHIQHDTGADDASYFFRQNHFVFPNYRSLDNMFSGSDHTAVAAGFWLRCRKAIKIVPVDPPIVSPLLPPLPRRTSPSTLGSSSPEISRHASSEYDSPVVVPTIGEFLSSDSSSTLSLSPLTLAPVSSSPAGFLRNLGYRLCVKLLCISLFKSSSSSTNQGTENPFRF